MKRPDTEQPEYGQSFCAAGAVKAKPRPALQLQPIGTRSVSLASPLRLSSCIVHLSPVNLSATPVPRERGSPLLHRVVGCSWHLPDARRRLRLGPLLALSGQADGLADIGSLDFCNAKLTVNPIR